MKNNGIITGITYLEKKVVFWDRLFKIKTKTNIPKNVPIAVPTT
jgi:hypothetical protein